MCVCVYRINFARMSCLRWMIVIYVFIDIIIVVVVIVSPFPNPQSVRFFAVFFTTFLGLCQKDTVVPNNTHRTGSIRCTFTRSRPGPLQRAVPRPRIFLLWLPSIRKYITIRLLIYLFLY